MLSRPHLGTPATYRHMKLVHLPGGAHATYPRIDTHTSPPAVSFRRTKLFLFLGGAHAPLLYIGTPTPSSA